MQFIALLRPEAGVGGPDLFWIQTWSCCYLTFFEQAIIYLSRSIVIVKNTRRGLRLSTKHFIFCLANFQVKKYPCFKVFKTGTWKMKSLLPTEF